MNGVRSQQATARRIRKGRIRDFLIYAFVAIGALTAVSLLAVFTKVEFNSLFKWFGFGIVTALVFGDTIRRNRRHWTSQRFWCFLGVFFAVQCGVGISVLLTVVKVPTIYWGLFFPLDHGLLAAYLAFVLDSRRD